MALTATKVGWMRVRRAVGLGPLVLVLASCGSGGSPVAQQPATIAQSSAPGGTTRSSPAVGTTPSSPAPVAGVPPAPVESNVPGDIPDNVSYVAYADPAGHFRLKHPEGWARSGTGGRVVFTDKLNGISAQPIPAISVPTPASARSTDIPALMRSQPAFELRSVKAVSLPAGPGVLVVYRRNSAPDPVTGRVFRDEVERYEIVSGGRGVALELYGAVGSDNVDPYTKVSQSLRLT